MSEQLTFELTGSLNRVNYIVYPACPRCGRKGKATLKISPAPQLVYCSHDGMTGCDSHYSVRIMSKTLGIAKFKLSPVKESNE